MDLPLIVDQRSGIPLYQQITHQLIYLISSRQLRADTRLPSIREAADALNVNPGTVAQAYRDLQAIGLVQTVKGRGTFVHPTLPENVGADAGTRRTLLDDALSAAITRGVGLGFGVHDVQQRLASLISHGPWPCRLAFVGPSSSIAAKHAGLLEESLGPDLVEVIPIDVTRLSARGTAPLTGLYFVTTFVSLVKRVEAVLRDDSEPRRIVPLSTRVSDRTLGSLAMLGRNTNACLVTEDANRQSAVNLVATNSRLPPELPVAELHDRKGVEELCNRSDVVIHTFTARDVLEDLGIRPDVRLELTFEIDPESIAKVRQIVTPVATGSKAGAA